VVAPQPTGAIGLYAFSQILFQFSGGLPGDPLDAPAGIAHPVLKIPQCI